MRRRKATWLKLEIVRQGRLQADVAHEVGISETRLSRLINARAYPQDYEINRLSRALGIDPTQLSGLLKDDIDRHFDARCDQVAGREAV